jgi:hypothetical protein
MKNYVNNRKPPLYSNYLNYLRANEISRKAPPACALPLRKPSKKKSSHFHVFFIYKAINNQRTMLMLPSLSASARSRAPQLTKMRTGRVRLNRSAGVWTENIPFSAVSTLTSNTNTSFMMPHTQMYSTMATAAPSISHSRRLSNPFNSLHSPTNTIISSLQDPHRCTAVRTRVFVSKHNQSLQVTSRDILDYFSSHSISTHDARTTASHVVLKECPFCTKPVNNKADNMYKCYVQIGGGAYFCHRCGGN